MKKIMSNITMIVTIALMFTMANCRMVYPQILQVGISERASNYLSDLARQGGSDTCTSAYVHKTSGYC